MDGQINDVVQVMPDPWPLKLGETLSSHDWFPFHGHQFLGSSFVRTSVMAGRREDIGTAVILQAEAMREDPAGTLPTDDIELADLARFRSLDEWLQVRARVLKGWVTVLVEDPRTGAMSERLGHPDIEDVVKDMYKRKRGRDAARDSSRMALKRHKIRTKMQEMGVPEHMAADKGAIQMLAEHFDHADIYITPDNLRAAMAEVLGYTGAVTPLSAHRRT